jgi:hypothetical protein
VPVSDILSLADHALTPAVTRVKYINVQYYFVCKKLIEERINLRYVPILEQVADGLTKALYRDKFVVFRKAVGVK